MGLRKYLGLDRRTHSRQQTAVDVEFLILDEVNKAPRTRKVQGRLTDISPIGACLQTNHTLIDGYHILLDNDPDGKTPLVLDMPSPKEDDPWTIRSQVLWYNKIEAERRYQFDVGLHFVNLSVEEQKNLSAYLKSLTSS